METFNFNHDFQQIIDQMRNDLENNIVRKSGLQMGAVGVIGATSETSLSQIINSIPSFDVVFTKMKNIEQAIDNVKENGISTLVITDFNAANNSFLEVRNVAKIHEIKIIVTTLLSKNLNERLTQASDFRIGTLEQDASLLIGITDKGISVNKNRNGDPFNEEITLDTVFELL